jgi:hypothetical protein
LVDTVKLVYRNRQLPALPTSLPELLGDERIELALSRSVVAAVESRAFLRIGKKNHGKCGLFGDFC